MVPSKIGPSEQIVVYIEKSDFSLYGLSGLYDRDTALTKIKKFLIIFQGILCQNFIKIGRKKCSRRQWVKKLVDLRLIAY